MDVVLKKIYFTIIMIFLSGGVLIFSIFTWFHPFKNDISSIDFTISSFDDILFSTTTNDFKKMLTREDFNKIPSSLNGISTVFEKKDGNITFYKTSNFIENDKEYIISKKDNKSYLELSFYIKSAKNQNLYLSPLSHINIEPFEKSIRVGFFKDDNNKLIWEPNSDIHTKEGVHKALAHYDKIVNEESNKNALEYRGIKSEISKKDKILSYSKDDRYFSNVFVKSTLSMNDSVLECFSLKKGMNKVKVYLWIESQDVDYDENDLFEQLQFSFIFTTKNS